MREHPAIFEGILLSRRSKGSRGKGSLNQILIKNGPFYPEKAHHRTMIDFSIEEIFEMTLFLSIREVRVH